MAHLVRSYAEAGSAGGADSGASGSVFASLARPDQIPLSSYQDRMWILHSVAADKGAFSFAISSTVEGHVNPVTGEKALRELISRNEILHTRYFEGEERAQQEVVDTWELDGVVQDLSGEEDPKVALATSIRKYKGKAIDITKGEGMRVLWSKLGEMSWDMTFNFHHICADNGSTVSFITQFVALYDALADGKDLARVPRPPVSYAEFAIWQNAHADSEEARAAIDWWRTNLAGAPPTSSLLPFARAPARSPSSGGERHSVTGLLPKAKYQRMQRLAKHVQATPFNFLTAAFRAFHHRYTGDDDLTLLMLDGNRPHPELANTIGFFVNMVPLRCRYDDVDEEGATLEQLLRRVRDVTRAALEHVAPFDSIVAGLGVKSGTGGHHPVGQIALNWQMYGKTAKFRTRDFEIPVEDGVFV